MNANTTTQTKEFIVYRDGEVDKELSTLEPHITPVSVLKSGIGKFYGFVSLQAEMAVYDVLHGTNYRVVRNQLVREKRNQAFESRIGLAKTL